MADASIAALRVRLYGTQGSGSVFPDRQERLSYQRQADHELLRLVFEDLSRRADPEGRLHVRLEEILGGPATRHTLAAYRDRFDVAEPRVYGGWTTCVHIETADGHDLVFDAGSGFRHCARDLQITWGDRPRRDLHLFGSHSHLDHTEGFDQAAVCFDPRNHLHVYGNQQFLRALDFNLGIFSRQVSEGVQGVQTPIFFGVMPATFDACAIVRRDAPADDLAWSRLRRHELGRPIVIGATTVTAFEVFHPAPCLAYRVEHGGRVFVFCTDHELWRGDASHPAAAPSEAAEARLREAAMDADVLYRDGQYLRAEYDGHKGIGTSGAVARAGWGHSCLEDVLEMGAACRIRRTLIGHHDPNRDWAERNWIDESLARRSAGALYSAELARAETVIEL